MIKTRKSKNNANKTVRRLRHKGGANNDRLHYTSDDAYFINLCRRGNITDAKSYVKTLLSQGSDLRQGVAIQAFTAACENGQMPIILWLANNYPYVINNSTTMKYAPFIVACMNGYLNVAQWLFMHMAHGNRNNNMPLTIATQAFNESCSYGQLHVAQWLLTMKPQIDLKNEACYAFRMACTGGHLRTAQWLLSVEPSINISIISNWAFRGACSNGHLEVAQWLCDYAEKINNPINKSSHVSEAFYQACSNGHLPVAQWLLEYSAFINNPINVSDWNNKAFIDALQHRHFEVAKWLHSLLLANGEPIHEITNNIITDNFLESICTNKHTNLLLWLADIYPDRLTVYTNPLRCFVNSNQKFNKTMLALDKRNLLDKIDTESIDMMRDYMDD